MTVGKLTLLVRRSDERLRPLLVLDRLILDYPESIIWVGKHDGEVRDANYSAAEKAVAVNFNEDFANAEKVFALPGVRRALVAYWAEALADLREKNAKSVYARYHFCDAVSQLLQYKRATQNVFGKSLPPLGDPM
jgi:hypothetical protein